MSVTNRMTDYTLLPSLPNPPTLPSGTFALYRNDKWDSWGDNAPLVIKIGDYLAGQRQDISGGPMQDHATWVAYNLPVGTVVTLQDNVTTLPQGRLVGDLSGAGRCVDLVGSGQPEAISLLDCNMNDCVSCFFWRSVDLKLGTVLLCEDASFKGNRTVLFLSEWPFGDTHSIAEWYLQDKISSMHWNGLNDRLQVGCFDNADGSGKSYQNVKGWGSFKSIADLGAVGFNDCMSSFNWLGLAPKKEVIDLVEMQLTFKASDLKSISNTTEHTNRSSVNQSYTAILRNTTEQTLTVQTTETLVTGVELGYSSSWKVGIPGTGELGGSLTLKLSETYTTSKSSTISKTETIELAISEVVVAVPNAITYATLVAQIGKIPPKVYSTIAHRWYDQPVTGSQQDPTNGWWKRDETVTGSISGGLAGKTLMEVRTTPLT